MKLRSTTRDGVVTPQAARNLSQQELRELLVVLTQTPTDAVLNVGYVLRLFVAVNRVGLPTGRSTGGIVCRGGLAAVSTISSRGVRSAAGAPASRYRSCLTIEDKEQAVAIIATAKEDCKQAKRAKSLRTKGGGGTVKGSGVVGGKAKQAKKLQIWAAKAKRTIPSLLDLLDSAVITLGIEDARLIKSHAEDISVEKAARVSLAMGTVFRV